MDNRRMIVLIQTARRALGMDDAIYRAFLEKHTGKRHCKECNEAELSAAIEAFRAAGFQARPAAPRARGGNTDDRPTDRQWGTLDSLARDLGFRSIEDERLSVLLRRVAKVDHPRFLKRQGAAVFIEALLRWKQAKGKDAIGSHASAVGVV